MIRAKQQTLPSPLTPAYTEQVRGAPRRLFFRRHFKFQISNLKFLPALRTATTGLPGGLLNSAPPEASSVVLRPSIELEKFVSRRRDFRTLRIRRPYRQFAFIDHSFARHQELSSPKGAGVFLFCRVRTKGPVLFLVVSIIFLHTFDAPA